MSAVLPSTEMQKVAPRRRAGAMPSRPRILFVAMQSSIHAARWIDCIADLGWDLHIFGMDDHPPNPNLRAVTLHMPVPGVNAPPPRPPLRDRVLNLAWRLRHDPRSAIASVERRLREALRQRSPAPSEPPKLTTRYFVPDDFSPELSETVPLGATGRTVHRRYAPSVLASVIKLVQPDLIHSMEFQHNAYRVAAARDLIGAEQFPPWLATNWGSDIYLFGREPEHAAEIRRVLAAADLYSCECHRDLGLARDFGYAGPDLPVLPNSGGMDLDYIARLRDPAPPSRRKLIMIKGYDHFAGRAMTSLAVLEHFQEKLRGYEVVLFSSGARPRARALELRASGRLNIRVIDWATHEEILRHFGRARLYMGISISDAISTSVLEAMAMGAFPIQTNTSCCEEWFTGGVGGFAIPPDDFALICDRFGRALEDDALVDNAAAVNLATVRARLALEVIVPQVQAFYRQAFEHLGAKAAGRQGA